MNQLNIFGPSQSVHYHNTVPTSGYDLIKKNEKSGKQEIEILQFFQAKGHGVNFTAWEVFNRPFNQMTMASVKRSMTNLMNDGYLQKTLDLRPGQYGERFPNRAYEITTKGLNVKLNPQSI